MVLVDTSVWVAHLRRSEPRLAAFLQAGEVFCHPFVVGELACGNLRRRDEILGLLSALPKLGKASGEEVLAGLSTFYFDLTASKAMASLDAIRHLVLPSHLMLGFDFPMMPASTIPGALKKFEDYGYSAGDRYNIVQGTALELLPTLAERLK